MRENRQHIRFQSEEVLDCYHGQEHFEAEILDVSWGGIRIGCLQDFPLGANIFIQHRDIFRSQLPVMTAIRWKAPGVINELGLEFQEGSGNLTDEWVKELFPHECAETSASTQRRSEVRANISVPIATELGFVEGETLDVSANGARFRLKDKLQDENSLLLCLPSSLLQVNAQVLRAEQDQGDWIHSVCFQNNDESKSELLSSFVAEVVG